MLKRTNSASRIRKSSRSSNVKSSDHCFSLDKFNSVKTNHSSFLDSAADKRGNWSPNICVLEDSPLSSRQRLNCCEKNCLDDHILDKTLLKCKKELKLNVNTDLHRCVVGKSERDKFMKTEEANTSENLRSKMNEQLQEELFQCQKTIQLLKSENVLTIKGMQAEIDSLRDELAKEIRKRTVLENSQATLMKCAEEMEQLLERERDQICDLMSNCNNLKQDSNHWEMVFKQEQQFRQELEQKYTELLNKERIAENLQSPQMDNYLLAEIEKLRLQYSDLIRQLNDLQTLANERQETEKKWMEENEQLRCTIDSLNKLLSEHVEKPLSHSDCSFSDLCEMRNRLKSAVQDSNLYQQRCNQLHYQIDDLKKELQGKICAMNDSERLLTKKIQDISDGFRDKETEFEKLLKGKDVAIEELEHSVQDLTKEKSSLMAQLHATSLELEGKKSNCRLLQHECQVLSNKFDDLKIQLKCQNHIEQSLNEMSEQKTKLSYENGLLACQLEKRKIELERLPTILSELQQLKKNALETDARNIKLQSDLIASETLVQQLESELKSVKILNEKLCTDLYSANIEKDEVKMVKQQLSDEVGRIQSEQLKTVRDLQASLSASKQDNANISTMLETVAKSHSNLQTAVDSIQTEKAKKDLLIEELTDKNQELRTVKESLESKLAMSKTHILSLRGFENSELAPLKCEISKLKDDNKRLLDSVETLTKTNEKQKVRTEQLQDEVSKTVGMLNNLRDEREKNDSENSRQKKNLLEKVEHLKNQLILERNQATKKSGKEKLELNQQLDQLKKKNIETNDSNSKLQCKNKDLLFKLKEEKQKTESLLKERDNFDDFRAAHFEAESNMQILRDKVAEMENINNEYIRKNEEQALTIQKFTSVVLELQNEFKSPENIKVSVADRDWQSDERFKVPNVQKAKLICKDKTERALRREMKEFIHELKKSRGSDLEIRSEREEDNRQKLKSEPKALTEISRNTFEYLIAKNSSCDSDLERRVLQDQLENEQRKTRSLEHKLLQIQESSLRHTEALAKELDIVKSSTKLFLADKK